MTLQHLRSSTANKRPLPGSMSDGQIAINTNTSSPGLFFKDSAGALVKVGPVHVGSTAPNVSPAGGGETGNTVGEQWLDTSGSTYVFKIWDGSAWRSEAGEFVNATGDVMTGALGIIAGSAGSPGLYFSGDTNTGIYSPGADQVAISTNGTGRLFVDSNGKVGIGTATAADDAVLTVTKGANIAYPGQNNAQLHINNSTGAAGILIASSTLNNIFFADAAANNVGRIYYDHSSDFLAFHTNSSERMRLDSSGRLGLGTSSPSSLLELSSDLPTLRLRDTTDTSYAEILNNNGTLSLRADEGSSGTTSFIDFRIDGSERARITSAGNVGIGTSNPGESLEVSGNIRVSSNSGSFRLIGAADSSNTTVVLQAGATSGTGGNIELDRNGDVVYDGTSHRFRNVSGASEYARIDSSGRLLVGTSSDSGGALLQVNGNRVRIATAKTPASASDTGTAGEICWDANYIYVCTATNTWKRTAISTW